MNHDLSLLEASDSCSDSRALGWTVPQSRALGWTVPQPPACSLLSPDGPAIWPWEFPIQFESPHVIVQAVLQLVIFLSHKCWASEDVLPHILPQWLLSYHVCLSVYLFPFFFSLRRMILFRFSECSLDLAGIGEQAGLELWSF